MAGGKQESKSRVESPDQRIGSRRPGVRFKGTNCTLVNLMLLMFKPMREDNLTTCILVLQLLCSLFAFFVRYAISRFVY